VTKEILLIILKIIIIIVTIITDMQNNLYTIFLNTHQLIHSQSLSSDHGMTNSQIFENFPPKKFRLLEKRGFELTEMSQFLLPHQTLFRNSA